MARRECGGCEGKGAHWRWCPVVVGRNASITGQQSARANNLADEVGANEPGAANHLYAAAALVRRKANEQAEAFRGSA